MFYFLLWAVSVFAPIVLCENPQSQVHLGQKPRSSISFVPADEWQRLNESVGYRLFDGTPVGAPCFDNLNGRSKLPDKAKCDKLKENRDYTVFIASQRTGYIQGNWGVCQATGLGCPVSPSKPVNESATCDQGSVPNFVVEVRTVSDVQRTLEFASKHDVPIVVKNSGHDYKGRSAGPDSLALWVHKYAPDPVLEQRFVPQGCTKPVGDVITIGAGQNFDGLYAFAGQNNVTVVGGSSSTVAPAGGWITGGGHSGLSPVYGLGVDNVQQIRVVLPNGTYVTANHCQNQDIFFALRGGGGGTFGVNMEMSVLAHPQTTVQFVYMNFINLTESSQRHLLTILVENANKWFDEGWGGYANPAGTRVNYTFQLMNPLITQDEVKESLAPLLAFADSLGADYELYTFPSFYELYNAQVRESLVRFGNLGIAQSSRLIPRSNFQSPMGQQALVDTLMSAVGSQNGIPLSLMLLLTTPSRDIRDQDSSVTPAWRDSTWHVIQTAFWDPTNITVAQVKATFEAVSTSMDRLRAITPRGGAYLNEGDTYEPDPVSAFWGGENHRRLLKIKHEIDPQGIMQVHQGIGSDPQRRLFNCYPAVRGPLVPQDEL